MLTVKIKLFFQGSDRQLLCCIPYQAVRKEEVMKGKIIEVLSKKYTKNGKPYYPVKIQPDGAYSVMSCIFDDIVKDVGIPQVGDTVRYHNYGLLKVDGLEPATPQEPEKRKR